MEQIETEDGERLATTIYEQDTDNRVLLIVAAVGVPRSYYRYIAQFFQDRHYSVLCFDYRGIGDSKPVHNSNRCSMQNWGHYDLEAAITFCQQRFSGKAIYVLGHSIAGQLLPLAESKHLVKRAYFVASQNVAARYWSGYYRLKVNLLWYLILPVFNQLFNGLPGPIYGGKEKLPKLVAREWGIGGRSRNGMPDYVENGHHKYRETAVPVKFISFSDDNLLSPQRASAALCGSYGSSEKVHQHLDPADFNLKEIGHFGFFRDGMQNLWADIEKWFSQT
ncbi:MAG: alpha/beta fold hydrolase [Calditrichaeota bacterium]|nr:alpha/beta fold hydrolase [Calditrichota bacterium]